MNRDRMIGTQVCRGRCWCPMCRDARSEKKPQKRRFKRAERQAWKRGVAA